VFVSERGQQGDEHMSSFVGSVSGQKGRRRSNRYFVQREDLSKYPIHMLYCYIVMVAAWLLR
jgi:hypothetical protein